MESTYPYQLVGFLDKEPAIGEPVYSGLNRWYPHIALKRRFKIVGLSESQLKELVREYWTTHGPLSIHTGALVKPERMPVRVIEVTCSDELMKFHLGLIERMATHMISRYPDRDGDNYLPHITAEYDGQKVIATHTYVHNTFRLRTIYLLKDIDSEDAQAYERFSLSA